MTEADLKRLEQKLIQQRREIFRSRLELEEEWQDLEEREIEYEEEAQKANLTELFERLDEREKEEIEEIDLALSKMAGGTYGRCERLWQSDSAGAAGKPSRCSTVYLLCRRGRGGEKNSPDKGLTSSDK